MDLKRKRHGAQCNARVEAAALSGKAPVEWCVCADGNRPFLAGACPSE